MFLFFIFIKISKFALPGVMLMYERTSKDRKKERKKGTSTALRGHIVGQIPTLKPRYVHGIRGPKGAGHTNDWCILSGD